MHGMQSAGLKHRLQLPPMLSLVSAGTAHHHQGAKALCRAGLFRQHDRIRQTRDRPTMRWPGSPVGSGTCGLVGELANLKGAEAQEGGRDAQHDRAAFLHGLPRVQQVAHDARVGRHAAARPRRGNALQVQPRGRCLTGKGPFWHLLWGACTGAFNLLTAAKIRAAMLPACRQPFVNAWSHQYPRRVMRSWVMGE